MTPVRIVVLGGRKVGKSAVTVRFLTKRYIGEYNSRQDHLYRHVRSEPSLIGTSRIIEILDVSGGWEERSPEDRGKVIRWSSGLILVYDICDRHSFQFVFKFLANLNNLITQENSNGADEVTSTRSHILNHTVNQPKILILANKVDMSEVGRKVETMEGKSLASKFNAYFFEVSAAESYFGITSAFDSLIRHLVNLRSLEASRNLSSSSSPCSSGGSSPKSPPIPTPAPVSVPVRSPSNKKCSISSTHSTLSSSYPTSLPSSLPSYSSSNSGSNFFPPSFLSLKKKGSISGTVDASSSSNSISFTIGKRSTSIDSVSSSSTVMFSSPSFSPTGWETESLEEGELQNGKESPSPRNKTSNSTTATSRQITTTHKKLSWTSQFNRLGSVVLNSTRKSSLSITSKVM